jgi:hypothetical protein
VEKPKAPFIYFGGKRLIADAVWARLGNVKHLIEPFFGSGAVLLARPPEHFTGDDGQRIETANDINAWLTNFWRACQRVPDVAAAFAEWPTSELDLHARGDAIFYRGCKGFDGVFRSPREFAEKIRADEEWFDPKIAGWWVWGLSNWIGDNWSAKKENEVVRSLPHLGDAGRGVARQLPHLGNAGRGVARQRPHLGDAGQGECARHLAALTEWFSALADRLRHVRICCGDWQRVVSDSVILSPGTPTGIFLDPPYSQDTGCDTVYGADHDPDVSAAVREWAIANGGRPELRIALCGYGADKNGNGAEHIMPDDWECLEWKTPGGYASHNTRGNDNRFRERVWFSPGCLLAIEEPGLFDNGQPAAARGAVV